MEKTETVQLTKEEKVTELIRLLREHHMEEAAENLFEMAAHVNAMEKKMDSLQQELETVKDQLHRIEEKGLKQTLKKAVNRLEQDGLVMKKKLSEVKAEIQAKAGEIVTAVKQNGKSALNRVSEFLGIKEKLQNLRRNVQGSIESVDQSMEKIDAFGSGMREASRKIANTFRVFAGRPEKEYGEKRFSKTELIKKSFLAKKKLLSGILNLADAAIEKTDRLAAEMKQYRADQADREPAGITDTEAADPGIIASVAEQEFRYGAEAFEAYQKEAAKAMTEEQAAKNMPVKNRKSR